MCDSQLQNDEYLRVEYGGGRAGLSLFCEELKQAATILIVKKVWLNVMCVFKW